MFLFGSLCSSFSENRRGYLSLLGCFLVHLSLGSFYSFGNLMTYMTSYMKNGTVPDITYGDFVIVQSVYGMTQGVALPLSGYVAQSIGLKPSIIVGCIIFQIATLLTYFSLQYRLWAVAISYGFMSAVGQSIALIPPMTITMRWFPERRGFFVGLVVGGFGLGSLIFNFITTAILNPDNVDPVQLDPNDEDKYFVDEDLLHRTPFICLILGGIYIGIQFIGFFFISEPPLVEQEEECNKVEEIAQEEVEPLDAVRTKEFYVVYACRFCITPITQDDHFLSTVGSLASIFNCVGRILYGTLMDKTSYKIAMLIETFLLVVLCGTFYLAVVVKSKAFFAIWVWAIYLTFPGTYAMQPAVMNQAFGPKYGGTIYGFVPSSDLINNFLVGVVSKEIIDFGRNMSTGRDYTYLPLFLALALSGSVSFAATLLFPRLPSPQKVTYLFNEPRIVKKWKARRKNESYEMK